MGVGGSMSVDISGYVIHGYLRKVIARAIVCPLAGKTIITYNICSLALFPEILKGLFMLADIPT